MLMSCHDADNLQGNEVNAVVSINAEEFEDRLDRLRDRFRSYVARERSYWYEYLTPLERAIVRTAIED